MSITKELNKQGLRVIAVAQKNDIEDVKSFSVKDESKMVLIGFIGFLDPPKERAKNEIGFSSVRGGNIVGEHSVLVFSDDESLEIKHIAYSRAVYAKGALKAAKFISDKSSGYYTMNNLIEIH